jgi:urea transport system substrate-binding protein
MKSPLLKPFIIFLFLFDIDFQTTVKHPIKVGLIFSTTGFRAPQEQSIQQATLMAIEEINKKDGLF